MDSYGTDDQRDYAEEAANQELLDNPDPEPVTQQEGVPMDAATFKAGQHVRAFHPLMFGVVREGIILSIGTKRAKIDFGQLYGGTVLVRLSDILEEVDN